MFAVGERADVASIVSELTKASDGDLGGLELSLVDAAGKPVRVPTGAKVVIATPAGAEVMSMVAAKDDETFGGELPPGNWLLSFAPSAGRRSTTGAKVAALVKKGAVAKATLAVTDVARLDASCTEKDASGAETISMLPCKVTLEGLEGTPTPDLGPAHVAGPARNQLIANVGEVAVAPGKYRLTFTRGPEYGAESAEVTLEAGSLRTVKTALRRIVDTSGYVATDFHQHTIMSVDAQVGMRDRILGNAAEAVEVAVATEHNVVADLGPLVRELGMSRFVVSIPGDELTTDASTKPWGHVNVFPMPADASQPRGGAPLVRDRLAHDVLDEVRAKPGPRSVIQINHPRSGANGYFDQLAFDPAKGVGTGAGYDAGFDALEVWNGRNVDRANEGARRLPRAPPHEPSRDGDRRHRHARHRRPGGRAPAHVRSRREGRRARHLGCLANRGPRPHRSREARRRPHERPVPARQRQRRRHRRHRAARGGLVEVKVHVTSAPFVVVDRAELRLAAEGKVVTPAVGRARSEDGRFGSPGGRRLVHRSCDGRRCVRRDRERHAPDATDVQRRGP